MTIVYYLTMVSGLEQPSGHEHVLAALDILQQQWFHQARLIHMSSWLSACLIAQLAAAWAPLDVRLDRGC